MFRTRCVGMLATTLALFGCGDDRLASVEVNVPESLGQSDALPRSSNLWFNSESEIAYERRDWMGSRN